MADNRDSDGFTPGSAWNPRMSDAVTQDDEVIVLSGKFGQSCGCEHVRHFPLEGTPEFPDQYPEVPRDGHTYLGVPAGDTHNWLVGMICDECAATCLSAEGN